MRSLRTPENQRKHERSCAAFYAFMRSRQGTTSIHAVSPELIVAWLLERATLCGRASRAPLVQQIRALMDAPAAGGQQSSANQWMAPASVASLLSAIATDLDLSRGQSPWDPARLSGNPARSVFVHNFMEAYRKSRGQAGHAPMPVEEVKLDSIIRLVDTVRLRSSGLRIPLARDVRDAQTAAAVCLMYALGDRPVDVVRMRFELIQPLDASDYDYKVFTVNDKGARLSARSDVVKSRQLLRDAARPEICPISALLELQLAYEAFGVPNPRSGFVFKALSHGNRAEVGQLERSLLTMRFKEAAQAAGLPHLAPSGVRRGSAQDYARLAFPDQTISMDDIMRRGRWLSARTAQLYLTPVAHNYRQA